MKNRWILQDAKQTFELEEIEQLLKQLIEKDLMKAFTSLLVI